MQETSKTRQTRVEYIDIAKGLGILTIIWGHIHTGLSVTDCFCSQKGGHIFNGGQSTSVETLAITIVMMMLISFVLKKALKRDTILPK